MSKLTSIMDVLGMKSNVLEDLLLEPLQSRKMLSAELSHHALIRLQDGRRTGGQV